MKTLVICSGGLASVAFARKVVAERTLTRLVSFDCGPRHRKELDPIRTYTALISVSHNIIDSSTVGCLPAGPALTSSQVVGASSQTRPE